MYSGQWAKQQIKVITYLWRRQQLRMLNEMRSHVLGGGMVATLQKDLCLPKNSLCATQRFLSSSREQQDKYVPKEEAVNHEDDDILSQNLNFKQMMMYNEEDDIIKKLNACETSEQLLNVSEASLGQMQKEHVVQTIVLLWMFRRLNDVDNHRSILDKIEPLLMQYVEQLNVNEISTCYLYIRKMGEENSHPLLQELLTRALNCVENSDVVGLPALSRLIVGINAGRNFFTPMLCANFIRHLHAHVNQFCTDDEARMIAIIMLNLQPLIDDGLMSVFKQRVKTLIDNGEISAAKPKTIIKILNMLNMAVWSNRHMDLIRDLLLTIKPAINQLDANDLKIISRIYQYHMEPACLQEPLSLALEELLATHMSPETLACYVPFSQPNKRDTLTNAFKALLASADSWKQTNATGFLFSILRSLKISDTKVCNAYWNGVLNELNAVPDNETHTSFLKHCHRYMNFNNNLGGTYRHMALEKKLSQMCMRAIEHDVSGRIPYIFARLASFVLAYGHTPYSWKKYPNIILSKIINMADQFTVADCFLISRGLRISLEMRYRYQTPQLANMQLATIDSVLTSCADRVLADNQLNTSDLNALVRMLSNRKTLQNSVVYHKTLQKYKEIQCEDLNSRIMRDMSYNFLATNYIVPEVLEVMFKYVQNHYEHILGETVEKLLSCAYNLGYTPESYESLEYAGFILLRDFNYMSGLSLVQACLALCYYKTIPEELINKVFCVKFIQRVEDEIQMCYSKATYPERVLNIVMQLNRSVCLDFPEANVPWFQQNFIEAQMSKRPFVETPFNSDVKNLLTTVLKDESYFRCNHTTPYGYQIDFVINFDKNRTPLQAPAETTMLDRITKVAILLLKLDSFCANDLNALRGPDSLKIKHLEMMGYKVLHINEHDWNSKYMNAPGAKTKYLKCLLQISN
ncbi:FAST kinase domain-containing protein 1, mitochondrial isoform X1 [Musca domestica]|uniref:FAST kinase domain-containing protein 1, mitochondrial isoform X1 n=3 Tax=Musca domestica TaxID=7370 RepID=A0A9J7CL81_MUSDO|nr:FAST kinase domain-containing protein 1, mitochondrial isoform X1 [Musca domestica]